MRRPLLSIFLVGTLCLGSLSAVARSTKLWSEKSKKAPSLVTTTDYSRLAKSLVPAVVSIAVEQKAKVSQHRMQQDPFNYFHRFFGFPGQGQPRMEQRPSRGIGTGFVINSEGLILTNNHVVEGADVINVTFAAEKGVERTLKARILGTAPEYDVALLQTDENAQSAIAHLGDSDQMQIGHSVMAIGNPFGLSHSVSVGIISAKERRDINPSGRNGLYNFIQTDASINPGNSGGPLVNMKGEVIGINTAINAAGSGIGFAIPINMVKEMLPQLRRKGKFARSWLGIRIQPFTKELAESYDLDSTNGALVSEVIEGGPADEAGLEDGDIILEFDNKLVRTSRDLPLYAGMAGVGNKVPVKVWRNNRERTYRIRLGEFPGENPIASKHMHKSGKKTSIGITVADINPELKRKFELELNKGIVIKSIEAESVASKAGLQTGDILLRVNGSRLKNARSFARLIRRAPAGTPIRLQIARNGGRLFLAFKKP